MDFFQAQDVARSKTGRLVLLFIAAILSIAALTHVILAIALMAGSRGEGGPLLGDWRVAAAALAFTVLIVGGGSLYKIAMLSGGGSVVAESLGGRLLHGETRDPVERKVLNVVEEMSIAAGVACPPVYMMDGEDGINAFAAGYRPEDAVIGVTRGCAELLDRDELQGVMAHEFSHILNGDMRMNIRLIGVLNGILLLGIIGYYLLRVSFYTGGGRRSSRGGGNSGAPLLLIGGGLALVGFVGTFFGNVIKAAVSRQREYLADASAVQFTRNPRGIADALRKIGGWASGSKIEHPNGPEASHMYFGRGVGGLNAVFATHPPLDERIRRIDPSWDGRFIRPSPGRRTDRADAAAAAVAPPVRSAPVPHIVAGLDGAVHQVGRPGPEHLDYAGRLITAIPKSLLAAAREPFGAQTLVFAMLLSDDEKLRREQLDRIARNGPRGLAHDTSRIAGELQQLDPRARLPLIDVAIPALRGMSPEQHRTFRFNLGELISADRAVDLFEWSLHRILQRHVDDRFIRRRGPRGEATLASARDEAVLVLSALAWFGHDTESQALGALRQGAAAAGLGATELVPLDECTHQALDRSVDRLITLTATDKRRLLEGAARCIAADRRITVEEAELFRAVGDALGCPVPPLVAGPAA